MVFAVIGLGVMVVGLVVGFVMVFLRSVRERGRFAAIVDVDAEVARLRSAAAKEVAEVKAAAASEAARLAQESYRQERQAQELIASAQTEGDRLRAAATQEAESLQRSTESQRSKQATVEREMASARGELGRLSDEVRKVEGNLEDISFGLYKPQYNFDTPDKFKAAMERVFAKQKDMVREGTAATFAMSWTVGDSKQAGARMQKQYTKLILRAFNGECDAAIAKVGWNNATRMEERIKKAFTAVNQLGEVMTVSLAPAYRDLKLAELHLEHELAEKKHEIADEQRRIREQMKDEEKALHEAEKAQVEAEAEEVRFQRAVDKAKVELSKARGEEHQRLNEKMLELQAQLVAAQAKAFRAKSLAEMTKSGYVYIISNVGSFGEHVFKIGMTRRLEPMDRVRELGGASVPFPFDVHAMVYSEDAPALEAAFHRRFKDRSVNLINMRKEFFHVDLTELEQFAAQQDLPIAFTKLAEAREHRESAAMRLAKGSGPTTAPVRAEDRLAMSAALAQFSVASRPAERPAAALPTIHAKL